MGAVEDEESEERNGAFMEGDVGRGVMSVDGNTAGIALAMVDERRSMCCLSWIDTTIFSRSNEVMCLSFPRLAAMVFCGLRDREVLAMSRGAVGVCSGSSDVSESMEASESTLEESSGTSFSFSLVLTMSISGVVASRGWVSQQSVSRLHIRQLMFSNLRPSSTVSAHFEKTAC